MNLAEYIASLQSIVYSNPSALDMEVVYSIDSEGNKFKTIEFEPTLGIVDGYDFIPEDQIKEYERDKSEINAVCIN